MPEQRTTPHANQEAADAGRHRPDPEARGGLAGSQGLAGAEGHVQAAGAPRIDPEDEGSVTTWAKKLDATPEQIREAVGRVGPRADEVELDLKGSRSTTNSERTGSTATGGGKGNA
ncbi:DUF3606 domain-containing protein [Aquabacterium sp. J223]|uniref:DUF3606 domain-containing protein n=1 Tax=Aquabacterium sp. J223 TaxID=2898431 RepID=UPI0021AE176C|nr:DUF3606 domain-containing protein [Aquabacterium sp. J223]UUX95463.1 DUF3606 domain-containing protein [Aquabacterium sp. J223]